MNTVTWIIQGLLAFVFLAAGIFKILTPKHKIEEKMAWAEDYSATAIKLIGTAELLGAVGLILPMGISVLPILTPIASFALAIDMAFAMLTHARRKESKEIIVNLILFLMALFITFMRFYSHSI